MYIPSLNKMTDRAELVDFMQRFSFATIITATNNFPVATHLPFLVSLEGEDVLLTSHFARANEQWKELGNNPCLVIFSEPHAYISPKNYEKELNVPTWNYISVHAYGQAQIISEQTEVMQILENTIDNYEAAYKLQWNTLPQDYKTGLAKGIVAFKIRVTDLQGKKKLSQNKTVNEQTKIIHSLSESKYSNEQLIAEYMSKNLKS